MSDIINLLHSISFSDWFSWMPENIAVALVAFFTFFIAFCLVSLILKIIGTFL